MFNPREAFLNLQKLLKNSILRTIFILNSKRLYLDYNRQGHTMIKSWSLQNKLLLGIILLVAVLLVAAIFSAWNNKLFDDYNRSIISNADTYGEENALLTAENINYSDIFKTDRLSVPGNFSSDYSAYAHANFIDAEVINFYNGVFESLKPGEHVSVLFNYSAYVYAMDKIQVVYDPDAVPIWKRLGAEIDPARVYILSSNGTILDEYDALGRYAYGNNSGIHEVQASAIYYEFSNCYFVKMRFEYYEFGGGEGIDIGFAHLRHSEVHQTVILDGNLTPLFICINESHF